MACWGHNTSGQIGTGNVAARSTPYVWSLPEAAVSVSAGANGSCAVTVSGNVWCSGSPLNTLVPHAAPVASAACARWPWARCTPACWPATLPSGAGVPAGAGHAGQRRRLAQRHAGAGAGDRRHRSGGRAGHQAGLTHTCATDDNHDVHCWGSNNSAQAGATAGTDALRATLVTGAKYTDHLALGGRFSCAYIGEGGVVSSLGLGAGRQQHHEPTASAVFSSSPPPWARARPWPCAITDGGAVYCWGTGMMGNGNVNENQWSPTAVSRLTGALAMAGGQDHSCVLRTGGSLLVLGSNSDFNWAPATASRATPPTR